MDFIFPTLPPLCRSLFIPPFPYLEDFIDDGSISDHAGLWNWWSLWAYPLLDTLEGQRNHLNGSTLLNQHDTEEYEGGNWLVYPQPVDCISIYAFQMVLNYILGLFAPDHIFLEMWGSLIVKNTCIILNSNTTYIRTVEVLSKHDITITTVRGMACYSYLPWSIIST